MARPSLGLTALRWSKPAAAPTKAIKRGRLNYANLQDKYILILLKYKLMLQLSGQSVCYKSRRIQEYKITLCLKGVSIQQVNVEIQKNNSWG